MGQLPGRGMLFAWNAPERRLWNLPPWFCPRAMPHIRSPIENTQAVKYGLTVEFIWWILGVILVTGYFIFVYRSSAGKVALAKHVDS
jgi:hypothetical protein